MWWIPEFVWVAAVMLLAGSMLIRAHRRRRASGSPVAGAIVCSNDACRHENPGHAKHCARCGKSLD